MQIAAVTGGAGFIGSHLVDRLVSEGFKVIVIDDFSRGSRENLAHHVDNPQVQVVEVDVSKDLEASHLEGVDWLFHLAALADIVPSIEEPMAYYQANVTGTIRVLEAARASNVKRLVYAASSSCYGIPDHYPTPEDAEARPQYPYAFTKNVAEQAVMHWQQCYGLPALALRFFNVYGPRARTSGTYGAVFGVFLAQKLAGNAYTVVGDGSQTRDFTYVSDVVDACVVAARSQVVGEAVNIGTGAPQSISRLVELLEGEVTHIPKRPGEPDCTMADVSKAERLFGWKATVPFEVGVKRMIENIDYWRDAPVWTPDSIADATKAWFKELGE